MKNRLQCTTESDSGEKRLLNCDVHQILPYGVVKGCHVDLTALNNLTLAQSAMKGSANNCELIMQGTSWGHPSFLDLTNLLTFIAVGNNFITPRTPSFISSCLNSR